VLCVDEKSGIQALDRSQPVLPVMPGTPERRSHDYVRHGTTDLFAAFNIADGTVISQLRRHHRAAEFKKFLVQIDKAVPAGLGVHLVCDNLATHKAPVIQAWLARHPRFRLHFTPTGSSWINQVERWFGYLTAQRIRRGVHKSVQALEADIRTWIEHWNQNPRPFTWNKTAGEILDSLAGPPTGRVARTQAAPAARAWAAKSCPSTRAPPMAANSPPGATWRESLTAGPVTRACGSGTSARVPPVTAAISARLSTIMVRLPRWQGSAARR
jgi:transposase